MEKLSQDIDCNPDGWVGFVDKQYVEEIKDFIKHIFFEGYRNEHLNFDNTDLSETILYHEISTGVIVELIDPECGSELFYEITEKIQKFMNYKEIMFF